MCVSHADNYGAGQGQDSFIGVDPITINGGANNPVTALQSATNISRSDSVVTVPIWDGAILCGLGACTQRVVGFMQLGIRQVNQAIPALPPPLNLGSVDAVILNVAGCGNATGTPIRGSGDSPIPVRLVR
jgi:hypothetical protein